MAEICRRKFYPDSSMLFLILLVIFTLYLFFRFRSVFPGVRGTFFAAAILVVFFGGFYLREHFAGMLLEAIFTVWFCEAMLLFLAWDVFRLIRRLAVRKPLDAKIRLCGNRIVFGLGILLSAIFFAFGVPVNNRYRTKELVVEIPKISEPFTAVFFSDLHIDPLFHRQKLERLAAEMDSIGPDFVLFGGDLADIKDSALRAEGYDSLFRRVVGKARIGAFGINGNHEGFMERSGSNPEQWMRENGMVVLDDSIACLPMVCFSGRTDFAVAMGRGVERLPLEWLLPKDTAKPWILMDHQPKGIEEGYVGRLPDLALSGHTHDGQFFPATALIGFFWRLSSGFGTLDGVPWLVSSGVDSWGPPVRIGSQTEIWVIRFEPALQELERKI